MSGDNGIYIRRTPDGNFWVAHLVSFYPDQHSQKEIDEIFKNGHNKKMATKDEALKVAQEMKTNKYVYTERGWGIWVSRSED